MKIVPMIVACSVLIAVGGAGFANKTIRNADEPANTPPTTFNGLQFVDNKGCVYVRSGYNGRITWIPRVDRRRRHLCSDKFKPTFEDTTVAAVEEKPKAENPFKRLSERLKTKPTEEPVKEETVVAVVEPVETAPIPQPEPQAAAPAAIDDDATEGLVVDKPKNTLLGLLGGTRKPAKKVKVEPVEAVEPVEVPKAKRVVAKPAPVKVEPVKEVAKPKVVVQPKPKKVAKKPEPVKVAKAEPEPVKKPSKPLKSGNYVRVGIFEDPSKAKATANWFTASGYKTAFEDDETLLVGPFRSEGAAKAALYQARGSGFPNASVVFR